MTIEEKVKAYDEAVKRAKKELQICGSTDCDAARQIFRFFPELKKSEDERIRKELIEFVKSRGGFKQEYIAWLEKQGEQKTTKIEVNAGELSDFERSLKHIIEEAIEDGDTHNLKADADMLLRIAHKPAWSEEDEKMIDRIRSIIEAYAFNQSAVDVNSDLCEKKFIDVDNWLKSIKDRAIPQPKQEWSEDDDWMKTKIIKVLLGCETFLTPEETIECVDFLKSIKDKYTWKPSDEQIEALGMATDICSIPEKYYDELSKLYFDLEKLKGE